MKINRKRNSWSVLILIFSIVMVAAGYCSGLTASQYFDKATMQYLVGDFEGAQKNLDIILKTNPKYPGALDLKNMILRERGMWAVGKKKIETKEEILVDYFSESKQLLAKGRYLEAAGYIKGILILDPGNKKAIEFLRTAQAKDAESKKLEKERLAESYRWLAIYVFLSMAFPVLLITIARQIKAYRQRVKRCFSCRSRISTNIDQCPNCGAWIGTKMQSSITRSQKSWYKKLGWRRNPFTLDIHPELFTGYRSEVKQILEKISAKSGHILITGPLGAGKSTLLRWLSNQLVIEAHTVYVPRPPQDFNQLIKLIIETIGGFHKEAQGYDIYHLYELRKTLGRPLIILLDEAHEFTVDIEKPLRTLGDMDDVKLVMAGLPETAEKFKNEIRPLYERLVLSIHLGHLDFDSFKEMIKVRIEFAGGEGVEPFTDGALQEIFNLSKGLPRTGIKACDYAVTKAINGGDAKITFEMLAGFNGGETV